MAVLLASIILILVPYFEKLSLELVVNILTSLVIILFFNNCKDNYFGLFDPSLVNSEKKKIKEREREYDNALHCDLEAEYLLPLKEFLERFIGNNLLKSNES